MGKLPRALLPSCDVDKTGEMQYNISEEKRGGYIFDNIQKEA